MEQETANLRLGPITIRAYSTALHQARARSSELMIMSKSLGVTMPNSWSLRHGKQRRRGWRRELGGRLCSSRLTSGQLAHQPDLYAKQESIETTCPESLRASLLYCLYRNAVQVRNHFRFLFVTDVLLFFVNPSASSSEFQTMLLRFFCSPWKASVFPLFPFFWLHVHVALCHHAYLLVFVLGTPNPSLHQKTKCVTTCVQINHVYFQRRVRRALGRQGFEIPSMDVGRGCLVDLNSFLVASTVNGWGCACCSINANEKAIRPRMKPSFPLSFRRWDLIPHAFLVVFPTAATTRDRSALLIVRGRAGKITYYREQPGQSGLSRKKQKKNKKKSTPCQGPVSANLQLDYPQNVSDKEESLKKEKSSVPSATFSNVRRLSGRWSSDNYPLSPSGHAVCSRSQPMLWGGFASGH